MIILGIVYVIGFLFTGALYLMGNAFGPKQLSVLSIMFYTVIWPITWSVAFVIVIFAFIVVVCRSLIEFKQNKS
jgi:hypothetical protein